MGQKLNEHKIKYSEFYEKTDEQARLCRSLQLSNQNLKALNTEQLKRINSQLEQLELKNKTIKDLQERLKHQLPVNYVDKHRIK